MRVRVGVISISFKEMYKLFISCSNSGRLMGKLYRDYNLGMKDRLVSEIFVNGNSVSFTNYSDDILSLPFGVRDTVTYSDLLEFYEDRCFPRERANCKDVLKRLGLDYYDPELICRKTHGLQFDDFTWLQFRDEPQVCYQDIKLRD